MKTNNVRIYLWGDEIGALRWDDRRQIGFFTFNPEYLKKGIDVFPLIHSILAPSARIPFFGSRDRYDRFGNIPPFIADSLPDNWGNKVFNDWAERNHIPPGQRSPADKLSFIGKRAMGALEFVPEAGIPDHPEALAIEDLYKEAQRLFSDREAQVISTENTLTKDLLYKIGSSAGGQRAKVIIAINPETRQIRSGQISGLDGFVYFLLKFTENRMFPAGTIEKTFYEMADLAGIDMMPCLTMKIDGVEHFMTARFDRPGGEKLHMLTLAAITRGCTTYEDLMRTARALNLSEAEQEEIFRRLCFNVMSGNTDDHDKNFSFLMTPDGKWFLAPAYDLTFTFDIYNPSMSHHAMSVVGKNSGINIEDLKLFAENQGIRNAGKIIRQVSQAVGCFRPLAQKNKVLANWIYKIENHVSQNILEEDRHKIKTPPTINGFSYISSTGQQVTNITIDETEKHDYRIKATINGRTLQRHFSGKHDISYDIARLGGEAMSESAIIHFVDKYLLSGMTVQDAGEKVIENIPEAELAGLLETIIREELNPDIPYYRTARKILESYADVYEIVRKSLPIFDEIGQYMIPISNIMQLAEKGQTVLEDIDIYTLGTKDSTDNAPMTTVNMGLAVIKETGTVVCFDPWDKNKEIGTLKDLIGQKRVLNFKQLSKEKANNKG